MTPLLLLVLLIAAALQPAPAELHITSIGDGNAIYGTDAHYSCAIGASTGVHQVTWQKLSEDGRVQNLATYSERFGQQVNSPFQDKVVFTEASLSSSAITVKNVTWADSSCYICSFNAFPSGSQNHKNCLDVQGISEVKTATLRTSPDHEGTKEAVFSCWTTGRPPPTIDWFCSDDCSLVSQGEATTTANDDGTFTSSRNASLQVVPGWSGHVDCLVNRRMAGETRERVHISFSLEENTTEEELKPRTVVIPVVCVLVLLTVAIIVIMAKKRFKKQNCGNLNRISKRYSIPLHPCTLPT